MTKIQLNYVPFDVALNLFGAYNQKLQDRNFRIFYNSWKGFKLGVLEVQERRSSSAESFEVVEYT